MAGRRLPIEFNVRLEITLDPSSQTVRLGSYPHPWSGHSANVQIVRCWLQFQISGFCRSSQSGLFILFATDAKSTENTRQPYNITEIQYDERNFKASLTAKKTDFKDAVRAGSLHIEKGAVKSKLQSRAAGLESRASWETSISLDRDVVGNIFKEDRGALDCTKCGSVGQIGMALHADWNLWYDPFPSEAYLEFWADNLGSKMDLALSGKAGAKFGSQIELWNHVIAGIGIPHVAELDLGHICFWGCDDAKDGWDVQALRFPARMSGEVSATAEVYAYTSLQAEASFLWWHEQVGLAAKAPQIKGKFTGMFGDNVCDNPQYHFGLQAELSVGLDLYGYAGNDAINSKHWDIFNSDVKIFCQREKVQYYLLFPTFLPKGLSFQRK
ncbi:hypothetical protein VFPPC_15485 [Pochonia chlamydosporia 170]|uniref:DUF7223 domain-containing protein n=1 Tax=Pochonia chlamydosporia 170 TaxID=1380566 RepID=A0A179FXK9_METCM|nr:hypothetical protein VFPPC_15485 [Pochonia chlamydosporia 170]OAQ69783.1 hypothetical protein VFPPC_15485 [Pochonia chlamydosporia 170]